jgi:hypothetical protein
MAEKFVEGNKLCTLGKPSWRKPLPASNIAGVSTLTGGLAMRFKSLAAITLTVLTLAASTAAQHLSKHLILKDGSFQATSKWEIKGDRVRYLSAERNEWEEMPKSLVDWDATEKYNTERAAGAPTPEAVELDKELEAERRADEIHSPHVAPGLRLPEDGGILLLDTFQGQPQLVELGQSSGEINHNMKGNILKGAINPLGSAKQTIELPGLHATVQAHAAIPSIYVNLQEQNEMDASQQPSGKAPVQPWDRFHIVKVQSKQEKRIVGDIKVAVYGKVSQEQKLVATTAVKLSGSWVKITPEKPLAPGEYAVVELLGDEGMNLYLWDFGVNPNAAANVMVTKPDPAEAATPEKPADPQKR